MHVMWRLRVAREVWLLAVIWMAVGFVVPAVARAQPEHPGIRPTDGSVVATNPPSMSWLGEPEHAGYVLELARDASFEADVIRVTGLDMPLYNHSEVLAEGEWYWRYSVVDARGDVGPPSEARAFRITGESVPFPLLSTQAILAGIREHPRIFTTPETLHAFRERRHTTGRAAWEEIRDLAERVVELVPPEISLQPLPADLPSDAPQVLMVRDGQTYVPADYGLVDLRRDASRVGKLALAYLISGDSRYAEAAKRWALFVADFRIDGHIHSAAERAARGTTFFSYTYEQGLKDMAQSYDWLYDRLSDDERRALLEHVGFHLEGNHLFLRDHRRIHLDHQQTQSMHHLFTASLATAGDLPQADACMDYLFRQYANRVAWLDDDGSYFEGQLYTWKFRMILEALAAMQTATAVDPTRIPAIRNAGEFWLYCMSLNYWFPHGGDGRGLVYYGGNDADAIISGFMASLTQNPYLQWWSQTVKADPFSVPLSYLAPRTLAPRPPVDLPQARAFHGSGQVAAYDRFYDHGSTRLFFRSSPWGGENHAHPDQNSFVLHRDGEILAADTGYYTYFNDEHYRHITAATLSHNSILVNGQGQGDDIEARGRLATFFHSPRYTFLTGDAGSAYGESVNRFDRSILYIRPGLFVMYDELQAAEPSTFTWLINTFAESQIDEAAQQVVTPQRDARLSIRHLLPEALTYRQSNQRAYPLQTRQWSRYTDAFPQPWNLQAETTSPSRDQALLTLMEAYSDSEGETLREVARFTTETTVGVQFEMDEAAETVLFSRGRDRQPIGTADAAITAEAVSVAVSRLPDGRVRHWMATCVTELTVAGEGVIQSGEPVDVAVSHDLAGAAAQVWLNAPGPRTLRVRVPAEPTRVFAAPPSQPQRATPQGFTWRDGWLEVEAPARRVVLWVDPVWPPTQPLPSIDLTVEDSAGHHVVPLQLAWAEDGDWIAFGQLTPREAGVYDIEATGSQTDIEILVQDHWDPHAISRRGERRVRGTIREVTEVFFRLAPFEGDPPTLRARLHESFAGRIDNLLQNGDFEVGLPGYPPRGWSVRPGIDGGVYGSAEQGWPGWSTDRASQGHASLRFVRPLNVITKWRPPYSVMGRNSMELHSVPLRLRTPGSYTLRFQAQGTATHAAVHLKAAGGRHRTIAVEPSDDWRTYETKLDLPAGFCEVTVRFSDGGEDDQVLYLDAMEFGLTEQP